METSLRLLGDPFSSEPDVACFSTLLLVSLLLVSIGLESKSPNSQSATNVVAIFLRTESPFEPCNNVFNLFFTSVVVISFALLLTRKRSPYASRIP